MRSIVDRADVLLSTLPQHSHQYDGNVPYSCAPGTKISRNRHGTVGSCYQYLRCLGHCGGSRWLSETTNKDKLWWWLRTGAPRCPQAVPR